jgi:septum formation protein
MNLVLASASPRRAELLRQLNLDFTTIVTDVDESVLAGESVEAYVQRVSHLKATAALAICSNDDVIISADTTVSIDKHIFGKPQTQDECINMLMKLSARQHRVLTAVIVAQGKRCMKKLSITEVLFRPITSQEAKQYWLNGEPKGKAGGYAIQGLGAMFVARIAGSYTGVMGLPLFELAELLAEFNVQVLE